MRWPISSMPDRRPVMNRLLLFLLCILLVGTAGAGLKVKKGELEKLKKSYEAEAAKIRAAHVKKLQVLMERYLREIEVLKKRYHEKAQREKILATKAGDLDQALKWRTLEREFSTRAVNLALNGKIKFNAERQDHRAWAVVDGKFNTGEWWGRTNPSWVRVDLGGVCLVENVRLLVRRVGGTPRDYEIRFLFEGHKVATIRVKDGKHLATKPDEKEASRQWIICRPPHGICATEVELFCERITGDVNKVGAGALVAEFEVLGQK